MISYRTPGAGADVPELHAVQGLARRAVQPEQGLGRDDVQHRHGHRQGGRQPGRDVHRLSPGDKSRLASETTRVFLSTQIQCAECHDHKFVDMPQETFHHVAAFFVRVNAKLPWNDSSQIVVSSKPSGEHKMEGRKDEMKPIAFSEREVELGISDVHAAGRTGRVDRRPGESLVCQGVCQSRLGPHDGPRLLRAGR